MVSSMASMMTKDSSEYFVSFFILFFFINNGTTLLNCIDERVGLIESESSLVFIFRCAVIVFHKTITSHYFLFFVVVSVHVKSKPRSWFESNDKLTAIAFEQPSVIYNNSTNLIMLGSLYLALQFLGL